jgi:GNAT superfamily N-acetyltransferase
VVLTFGFSFEYGGRDAFIDELYLEAAHRGKGIGGLTIDFVSEQAKVLGVKALHLEVERHNDWGNRLYRKKGFGGNERHLLTKWL